MEKVELDTLDGPGTRAHLPEIQEVYTAAFPGYDLGDHRQRTLRQTESPAFSAITARDGGRLVGFVYGLPLAATTGWWDGLEPPPAERGFTTETGDRTFAVIDLAVLPSHRRQGLGRRLVDELLRDRPEERATLLTTPSDTVVQEMYRRWGWHMAGTVPGGVGATEPVFNIYVIALR